MSQINMKYDLIEQIKHFRFGVWRNLSSSPSYQCCSWRLKFRTRSSCLRGSVPFCSELPKHDGDGMEPHTQRGAVHRGTRGCFTGHCQIAGCRLQFSFTKEASNHVCLLPNRRWRSKTKRGNVRDKSPSRKQRNGKTNGKSWNREA